MEIYYCRKRKEIIYIGVLLHLMNNADNKSIIFVGSRVPIIIFHQIKLGVTRIYTKSQEIS